MIARMMAKIIKMLSTTPMTVIKTLLFFDHLGSLLFVLYCLRLARTRDLAIVSVENDKN